MIFVVIGLTGSGKTNFIDALSGTPPSNGTGANSLISGTRVVLQHTVKHDDGQSLIFLDTPGFNNIFFKDEQIVALLAAWLKTNYRYKIELSIIYLHRITDNRIIVPPPKYIDMLRNQCSNITVRQICLVTTMWDDVVRNTRTDAERREELLKEEFRKRNVRALFERFENQHSSRSAWNIANKLMDGTRWLQADLEDRERRFNSLSGEASYTRFQQLILQRKELVQRLVNQATTEGNLARVQELQAEHETLDAQLQLTFEQVQERNISLRRRALQWLRRITSSLNTQYPRRGPAGMLH